MSRACIHRDLKPSRLAAAATFSGALACTLALPLGDQIPCSLDSDCPYSNGQGVCDDGFCRPPGNGSDPTATGTITATAGSESSTVTSDGPTTTASTDTSSSSTETTAQPACTLNSECETDQRCGGEGTCVDLLSAQCQTLQWPAGGQVDDVVFVGSIMPTSPPFTNLVQPLENAVQLAIEDFNQQTSLQGDRKIAWVGCDDSAGGNAATNAATHLVENVGAPAIVGPIFSESVLEVANTVTIDSGTFLMAPAATAMSIADLDDDDLVWRTIAGDVYQSNAIVDRLIDLDDEAAITNLLILAKDDAYGNGILNAILGDVEAALPTAAIHFSTYPNPTSFVSQDQLLAAYGQVLAAASVSPANNPYFTHVLFIGTSEIQALLYAYLGQVWQGQMGDPMPLFTVTHGAVPEMARFIQEIGATPATAPLVPLKPLIESRLQGTSPVALNPANFDAFSVRYRIRFNDQVPLTSAALSYDATMSTLFAMCTIASDEAVTGAGVALGMPRLVTEGAQQISFSGANLSFIANARNALATGGSVDLQGVSGELQWDVATGDVRANGWGWDILDASNPPDGSMPVAQPRRIYVLNPAPAQDGTWMDIP